MAFVGGLAVTQQWAAGPSVARLRSRRPLARKSGSARLYAKKEAEPDVFDEKAARAAELKEVIDGLGKFRERIVDEVTTLGKKVKTPKKKVLEALSTHPDIIKIDNSVAELEGELRALQDE